MIKFSKVKRIKNTATLVVDIMKDNGEVIGRMDNNGQVEFTSAEFFTPNQFHRITKKHLWLTTQFVLS